MSKEIINNNDEKTLEWLNPLLWAKQDVNKKLTEVLNKAENNEENNDIEDTNNGTDTEEINEDEDLDDEDGEAMFLEIKKMIDNLGFLERVKELVNWFENLLKNGFENEKDKKYIRIIFLQNSKWYWTRFYNIINFCKSKELEKFFTLDQLFKLAALNPDKVFLNNFLEILDLFPISHEEDIDYILENPVILTDNITKKAVKLHNIIEQENNNSKNRNQRNFDFDLTDFKYLKDVELTDEFLDKTLYLMRKKVYFSIKDFPTIQNLEIDNNLNKKLETLTKEGVITHLRAIQQIQNIEIDKELIWKIRELRKCWVTIYSKDLEKIKNLRITKEDTEKLTFAKNNTVEGSPYGDSALFFSIKEAEYIINSTKEEVIKAIENSKKMGFKDNHYVIVKPFINLSDEVIGYCAENKINNIWDIEIIKSLYSMSDRENIREYIKRKKEFLKKNKLLSDEKYIEYFWWKWKFWKHEINQWNIWLCYLYSGFEIIKKMNWFDAYIQSNFLEKEDGWLIRIPFNTWSRIKVNKEEIDKEFTVKIDDFRIRKMNINSNSEFLWFKILEIAFIKNLITKMKNSNITGTWEQENPIDTTITWEKLAYTEWWDTIRTLKQLYSKENVSQWIIAPHYARLKKMKWIWAPDCILDNIKKMVKDTDKRTKKLFELYKTWLITIELSINNQRWNDDSIVIKNAKIVDKSWNEITDNETLNEKDIKISPKWKRSIELMKGHAYSVEKCYINEKWEETLRIVNPWHTGIKFDISLKEAQKIFTREFWAIKIDNLFKEETIN